MPPWLMRAGERGAGRGRTVAIAVIGICLAYGLTLAVVAAVRLKRLRGKTYQQRKTRLRGHSGTLAQARALHSDD